MSRTTRRDWRRLVSAALISVLAGACHARTEQPARIDLSHPVAAGRQIFLEKCAACHGPDGKGLAGKIPALAGAPWVNGPPDRVAALVLDGLSGRQEINGVEYNGVMPAWRSVLTDPEIAAVLTYVRQAWGNHAPPVSTGLVDEIDQRYQARRGFWTAAELKDLPNDR
jgi:mono/diheme cytochrome c family protein